MLSGPHGGRCRSAHAAVGPRGEVEEPVRHLVLFVGADPASGWLDGCGVVRERGFVAAGDAIPPDALAERIIWCHRQPAPLETSVPGVFAISEVRAGSVKRVGAAIGRGAAVVAQIHAHLAAPRESLSQEAPSLNIRCSAVAFARFRRKAQLSVGSCPATRERPEVVR